MSPITQPSVLSAQSSSPPLVAVVVVTWNGRDHLRRCLDAVAGQTYSDFEVVVVDNGSTDGTSEMLRQEYPHVQLIENQANLGFAAANNLAIRATDTPYVATLNNDATPEPPWLAALVAAAEADPTLGSVSSKMVFAHDPATINSCGIALDPAGIAWDLWGGYPARAVDRPREVFGACAGAALYRRTMLEDVGPFDEDFFAYLEDVDLAWRARLRGWRCVLAPEAAVLHAHSGTLGEGSPLKSYLLARNKIWTIAKGAPAPDLWRWLPLMALYDVGAATFAAVRHGDWAAVRGRLAGLSGLPTALRKRREIQARRTASAAEVRHHYSPLALPWDVPRRYRHLASEQGTADSGQGTGYRGQKHGETGRARDDSRRRLSLWERARPEPVEGPASPPRADETGEGGTGRDAFALAPADGWRAPFLSGSSPRTALRRLVLRALGLVLQPPRAKRRYESRVQGSELAAPGPRPPAPGPHPHIVVLRPDHLGDVLLSRPAIELIRRAAPHAAISVVVGPWGLPSLRGMDVRIATFPFPGFITGETSQARPQPVVGAAAPTAAFLARRPGNPLAAYTALLAFAARLRRERYEAALVLRPDHWWGAMAAAVAGIPVRVGHHTPETAPFLTHALDPVAGERSLAASGSQPREHATEAGLRAARALLRALGMEHDGAVPPLAFYPSPGAVAQGDEWLSAQGLQGPAALSRLLPPDIGQLDAGDGTVLYGAPYRPPHRLQQPGKPTVAQAPHPEPVEGRAGPMAAAPSRPRRLVAIHPGAGSPLKLWPPQRWAAVADSLDDGAAVFLTGGAADLSLVAAIQAHAARPLPAALGLDWEVLAALYQKADLVLGMDSGPLHLAAAVGTPTLRIYGPSDPRIYGPVGEPSAHTILQSTLPCVPCGNLTRPPCGYLQEPPCLATVTVETFLAQVRDLLPQVASR